MPRQPQRAGGVAETADLRRDKLREPACAGGAAERSFSASAAHDFRIPIAATLVHTQRLITEAPESPLRQRASTIETELKRMAPKLLNLTRAEAAGTFLRRN